jgi:2-oxoglutarate ferredoxin oxidoreductase subunit alpha
LCQNSTSIDPFDLSQIEIDRGKLVTEEDLAKMAVYKRYEFTDDGISPRSIPSQKGGESQVTGNEHNEFGAVSTDKTNRLRMMRKRMMKLEIAKKDLPKGKNFGPKEAKIGIIGFGSTFGPIMEGMEQLSKSGVIARFHQIRTIWPLLEDDLQEFLNDMDVVFVVENNYQGQLASLIRNHIDRPEIMQSITKFDGSSFKPKEISGSILSSLGTKMVP